MLQSQWDNLTINLRHPCRRFHWSVSQMSKQLTDWEIFCGKRAADSWWCDWQTLIYDWKSVAFVLQISVCVTDRCRTTDGRCNPAATTGYYAQFETSVSMLDTFSSLTTLLAVPMLADRDQWHKQMERNPNNPRPSPVFHQDSTTRREPEKARQDPVQREQMPPARLDPTVW
jgi:hypothetical protein